MDFACLVFTSAFFYCRSIAEWNAKARNKLEIFFPLPPKVCEAEESEDGAECANKMPKQHKQNINKNVLTIEYFALI